MVLLEKQIHCSPLVVHVAEHFHFAHSEIFAECFQMVAVVVAVVVHYCSHRHDFALVAVVAATPMGAQRKEYFAPPLAQVEFDDVELDGVVIYWTSEKDFDYSDLNDFEFDLHLRHLY